ncbi:hypothetical protein [uncultured Dokdonia sp.]|uniref:hypothetical protein n=1 Tax=uncultured Dokdonia sp. TaxID=575653 RepID=UPI002609061D|nr:hypothetical protein [uncultured Dokdonia sp.]
MPSIEKSKKLFPRHTTVEEHPTTICYRLPAVVFKYPFFNEGIKAYRMKGHAITNETLDAIDIIPNRQLDVKGFIFHTSHCGSTLLVRMLQTTSSIRVISETEAINGLLLSYVLHNLPKETVQKQLKEIIESYCQPLGNEKHVIFKLTSWNVFMINLFLELYPTTKWIYLDRKTDEVVASLKKSNGGFAQWWQYPSDFLKRHFTAKGYSYTTKEDYLIHMVEQHRKQAQLHTNSQALHTNYTTLLDDFEKIMTHFDLNLTSQEIENAKKATAYYSKSVRKIPFPIH